jgi:pSer/pThr/pTyr-binding forkhead associated (FHA) protein
VSGEHCRLTADGHTFLLEDLNSTNGTYVNGERLTTAREVRLSDRITLGKTHPMPWPVALKPAGKTIENPIEKSDDTYAISGADPRTAPTKTVITIGRGLQNSVVLNESNISTQHARLTITPDRIILEDLGSTNGTSVGTVENKIHRAEIDKEDAIFFGSTACSLFELIQRHNGVKPTPSAKLASPVPPTTRSASKPAASLPPWIAGSLGTAAILLIGWIIFGRSDANTPTDTAGIAAVREQAVVDPVSSHGKNSPPLVSEKERLARSLFVIVASDAERKTPFRVGTGFAIDARHVATTASVMSALHNLQQNGYPETFLYCPATGRELEVAEVIVHPGFHSADEVAKSAQAEYESIMEQYEAEPPSPEKLESVKSQLLSAQEKAFLSFERKTTFDVAVVETSQPLKYWLAAAEPGTVLRPNLKLNVRGLAHDVEDPFFDPQSLGEPEAMTSRVRQVKRLTRGSPPRLLAAAGAQQRDYAWFGSPVLNARGQVVAIYSRPTPPATEAESADPPLTFDAPLFNRVRECLPDQP